MTGIDDTLKIVGMAAIGILGIILVLAILSALCVFLALFAYVSLPGTPTVTISPIENLVNHTSAATVIPGQASAIIGAVLSR